MTIDPTTIVRIAYATVTGPMSSSTAPAAASVAIASENSPRGTRAAPTTPFALRSAPSRPAATSR